MTYSYTSIQVVFFLLKKKKKIKIKASPSILIKHPLSEEKKRYLRSSLSRESALVFFLERNSLKLWLVVEDGHFGLFAGSGYNWCGTTKYMYHNIR